MLADQDPNQNLLQQVVGGFLAIVAGLVAWIAKLKAQRGLTEHQIRKIIREEIAEEFRWRQYGPP